MSGPEHIIVLMLENNSFDRIFGALFPHRPHATNPGGGTKGTANNYTNSDATKGAVYHHRPTRTREVLLDPGHELNDTLAQMSGSMGGFVTNFARKYPRSTQQDRQEIMGFYEDGY